MDTDPRAVAAAPGRAALPAAVLAAAVLAGCATMPGGPSVMALPGSQRTFAEFKRDDDACRAWALERIGGRGAQAAADDAVAAGAVGGAAIGGLAGAAIGGSHGAAVGAGTGLAVGAAVGSGNARASGWEGQRRFDQAYVQCMYAAGHKVPVVEGTYRPPQRVPVAPPPTAAVPPAPPPGAPPAPPPAGRAASGPGAAGTASAPPPRPPVPPPGAPPPPPPSWRPG